MHLPTPRATNPFTHLERNAVTNPTGSFLETIDHTVTNQQTYTHAKRIAHELRRLGIKPGDIVALDLPETLSLIFTQAVFHEAAISTIFPRDYEPDGSFDIHWMLTSARPTPPPKAGATVIPIDSEFLRRVENHPIDNAMRQFDAPDSIIRLMFSSGTTGHPHAVAFTLELVESFAENALDTFMMGDPFLIFLPTATTFGYFGYYVSVKQNRPYWPVTTGDAATNVDLALRSRATSLKGSPAQIADIVAEIDQRGITMPLVETVHVAGTVMPAALASRVRKATEGCEIYNLYGSTEATLAAARLYDSDDPYDAGHIDAHAHLQIVDEDDKPLPDGEVGRIRYRTPAMVHAYYGNPDASQDAFRDGWFYPGDLGRIRPDDGGLTLAGRASEVLNAGGVKVDPNRLDLFAIANPRVSDAATFERSTATGNNEIGIALVTDDDLDVHALARDFAEAFGSAAPKFMVRTESIPRNAMGKPLRRELTRTYSVD